MRNSDIDLNRDSFDADLAMDRDVLSLGKKTSSMVPIRPGRSSG
jgi:hypothetical protein